MNRWHSSPIPPLVQKNSGVKVPCSISRTRWRYSLFFASLCDLKMADVFLVIWLRALTCVVRISKNAVCPLCQNPLALMSSRDSSFVFADFNIIRSPVTGIRWGSASTSLHTLSSKCVKRSLMLSWRWCTKPPFWQDKACVTLKRSPHRQFVGSPESGRLYLSASHLWTLPC